MPWEIKISWETKTHAASRQTRRTAWEQLDLILKSTSSRIQHVPAVGWKVLNRRYVLDSGVVHQYVDFAGLERRISMKMQHQSTARARNRPRDTRAVSGGEGEGGDTAVAFEVARARAMAGTGDSTQSTQLLYLFVYSPQSKTVPTRCARSARPRSCCSRAPALVTIGPHRRVSISLPWADAHHQQ